MKFAFSLKQAKVLSNHFEENSSVHTTDSNIK